MMRKKSTIEHINCLYYRCKLSVQAPPRSLKLKKSGKKKRPEQLREEVIVDGTPRTAVDMERDKEKRTTIE